MIKSGASTRYLDSNNNIILNAVSNEDLAESFSSDIFSKSVTTSYSDSVAQEFRKKILSYDPDTNPDSTDTDNIVTALYDMDSYIDTYTNTKGIQRVSSTLDSDSPLDDNAIATTQEERNSIVADWSDSIVSEFFSLTETHFSLLTKNADGGTVANIPKTADFPSLRKNFITSTKNVTGRIGFATFNPDATINTNDSFTDGGATPFFTPNFLDVDGKMYNVPFPVIVPKDIDSISENATARTDIYSAFNAVVYGDKYSVDTN